MVDTPRRHARQPGHKAPGKAAAPRAVGPAAKPPQAAREAENKTSSKAPTGSEPAVATPAVSRLAQSMVAGLAEERGAGPRTLSLPKKDEVAAPSRRGKPLRPLGVPAHSRRAALAAKAGDAAEPQPTAALPPAVEAAPAARAGKPERSSPRSPARQAAPAARRDAEQAPRGDARPAARRPASAVASVAGEEAPVVDAAADGLQRVSKILAARGLCSRREADGYIERGLVFVNGQRVTLGTKAAPDARITLAPEANVRQQQRVTILLHKPVGYVSGQPEPGYEPAVVLIERANEWIDPQTSRDTRTPRFQAAHKQGLAPAGRLDIDSTGLLVLTQDGRIARQLIGENSEVDKEYLVRVSGELIASGLQLLNHGLELDGQPLRRAKVEWINDDQLRFVLREGKKRQIRRMCELVGLKVVGLKRIRIGKVKLGDLPLGQWRYLRDDEAF